MAKVIKSHLLRRKECVEYFVEKGLVGEEGYKEAMKFFGYKPQLLRETYKKKFNSPEVQGLIADEIKKHEYTIGKAVQLLNELKMDCETSSDRTNRLGCIKELDRINGLYGDEDNGIHITQVIVSPQERRAVLAKEMKLLDDIDAAPLAIAE